jgi:hypothetical protein
MAPMTSVVWLFVSVNSLFKEITTSNFVHQHKILLNHIHTWTSWTWHNLMHSYSCAICRLETRAVNGIIWDNDELNFLHERVFKMRLLSDWTAFHPVMSVSDNRVFKTYVKLPVFSLFFIEAESGKFCGTYGLHCSCGFHKKVLFTWAQFSKG